jgi:predicted metal-dependent hydrolase
MEQITLEIAGQKITATLKTSRRARQARLEIGASGLIIVKPWGVPRFFIERFIKRQTPWIQKNLARYATATALPSVGRAELKIIKKRAAQQLITRLEFYNLHYHLTYRRLTVRDQKTRWGSCSPDKALSFNYRLLQVPPELLDYVVVHELCHLQEMNHSARFWSLVGETLPDYRQRRRALQRFRLT